LWGRIDETIRNYCLGIVIIIITVRISVVVESSLSETLTKSKTGEIVCGFHDVSSVVPTYNNCNNNMISAARDFDGEIVTAVTASVIGMPNIYNPYIIALLYLLLYYTRYYIVENFRITTMDTVILCYMNAADVCILLSYYYDARTSDFSTDERQASRNGLIKLKNQY